MLYDDFLDTVKVLKMLYGREVAALFFESNIHNFVNLIDGLDNFADLVEKNKK